jgi:hypothetical protein
MELKLEKVETQYLVEWLLRADEAKNSICLDSAPKVYETLAYKYIASGDGVDWQMRKSKNVTSSLLPFKLSLGPSNRLTPRSFLEMSLNVLYFPVNVKHPVADQFYRVGDVLYVLQFCFGIDGNSKKRTINGSTFELFANRLNLKGCKKVVFMFFPHPSVAHEATIELAPDTSKFLHDRSITHEEWVVHVPKSYTRLYVAGI